MYWWWIFFAGNFLSRNVFIYIIYNRGIAMPGDLDSFIDILKSRDGDDVLLNDAKNEYSAELSKVETFARDLGDNIVDGLKNTFSNKDKKTVTPVSNEPLPLTQKQKGNNLFNDVGCDFKGTYFRFDKPLTKSKNTSIYTDIGPRKQDIGIEYKKNDSTVRLGVEHKHSVGAAVVNYNYDTGLGNLSVEAKASKDVNGVGASYRAKGLKINASVWEGDGVLVNFEKNMQIQKSDVTFGGVITDDYGFVYCRIAL